MPGGSRTSYLRTRGGLPSHSAMRAIPNLSSSLDSATSKTPDTRFPRLCGSPIERSSWDLKKLEKKEEERLGTFWQRWCFITFDCLNRFSWFLHQLLGISGRLCGASFSSIRHVAAKLWAMANLSSRNRATQPYYCSSATALAVIYYIYIFYNQLFQWNFHPPSISKAHHTCAPAARHLLVNLFV